VVEEKVVKEKVTEEIVTEEKVAEEIEAVEKATERFIAAENATEEKAVKEKVTDEIVTEEIVTEEKVAEEIEAVEKATEKFIAEENASEVKAAKEKITEGIVAEKKAAEEIAAEKKVAEEIEAVEKATEKFIAEEKTSEVKAAKEKITEGIVAEKKAAEEIEAVEKATEKFIAEEKTSEVKAAKEKITEGIAAEKKAAEEIEAVEKATEKFIAEEKTSEEKAAKEKAAKEKATEGIVAKEKVAEEIEAVEKATEKLIAEEKTSEVKAAKEKITEGNVAEKKVTEEAEAVEKSTEKLIAEEKTSEVKAVKEKVTEEIAAKEKVAEEKVTEKFIAEEKTSEVKAAKEKITEGIIADKKAAEEITAEKKVAEEKATQKSIFVETATEEKAADGKISEEKAAEDKLTKGNVTKEKAAEDKLTKANVTKEKAAEEKLTKSNVTEEKTTQEPLTEEIIAGETLTIKKHNNKAIKIALICTTSLLVLALAAVAIIAWYYQSHATPNTWLAGMDIGGKTKAEISKEVEDVFPGTSVDLTIEEENESSSLSTDARTLGINVDCEGSIDQVFAGNTIDIFKNLSPNKKKEHSLLLECDDVTLDEILTEQLAEIITFPKEPKVYYNKTSEKFKAKKGKNGNEVSSNNIVKELEYSALKNESVSATVQLKQVPPAVSNKEAKKMAKKLNKMMKTDIRVIYEGEPIYTFNETEIASWIGASNESGKLDVKIKNKAIEKSVSNQLPGHVTRDAVDEIVLLNSKGKVRNILQQGSNGRKLANTSGLSDKIAGSLGNEERIDLNPEFTTLKYGTKKIVSDGGNWVEVALGAQRVTLWSGDKKLNSFTISSGKSATPTPTGTFSIWLKRDDHTMRGGDKSKGTDYAVPHVRYISYFHGSYAFHAAYWHNAFGTPVSHGCINMRTADAKILYDFAPIGTKVVVHG